MRLNITFYTQLQTRESVYGFIVRLWPFWKFWVRRTEPATYLWLGPVAYERYRRSQ